VETSFAFTFSHCFYSCAPVEIKQHDEVPLLSVGEMQVVSIRGVWPAPGRGASISDRSAPRV